MSAASGVPVERLLAGRRSYVASCTGCHRLHAPEEYQAGDWRDNLAVMGPKAHLAPDAAATILAYLLATCGR